MMMFMEKKHNSDKKQSNKKKLPEKPHYDTYDICYTIYPSSDGGVYVDFKVHLSGDIRGNYSDSCILYFASDYEFFELFAENDKSITMYVHDEPYIVDISIVFK